MYCSLVQLFFVQIYFAGWGYDVACYERWVVGNPTKLSLVYFMDAYSWKARRRDRPPQSSQKLQTVVHDVPTSRISLSDSTERCEDDHWATSGTAGESFGLVYEWSNFRPRFLLLCGARKRMASLFVCALLFSRTHPRAAWIWGARLEQPIRV